MFKYLAITVLSIVLAVVALTLMYDEPRATRASESQSVECPICPVHNA